MSPLNYSLKKIAINILIILGLSLLVGFAFLKLYLPTYTNHGETVSVPELSGYNFEQSVEILERAGLQYEVSPDSGFSTDQQPLAILKQIPAPKTQVKSGRKIYLTLNARNAPIIKMPDLVNIQLKNVQEMLANLGLERGDIIYVPDIGINVVLETRYRGVAIQEGFEVPKGARIDLVVGDGMGNQILTVPSLIGLPEEDAEFLILGSGLRIGKKNYALSDSVAIGQVYLQAPSAGTEVRTGEIVDIWVSKN